VCVSATEIATGRTVTFVDHHDRTVPTWTNDALHIARPARIAPEHALASAAIPLLFPAVRVGDTYFCDGSLRQQTPLAPALRLGSNRVLVVGLRHGRPPSLDDPLAAERIERMHSAGFLFGKVLNALDRPTEYDRADARDEPRAATSSCGATTTSTASTCRPEGAGSASARSRLPDPAERDIGSIAARHVERVRSSRPQLARLARLRRTLRGSPSNEADCELPALRRRVCGGADRPGYRDAEADGSRPVPILQLFTR
jgi:NTE family protein